MHLETDTLGKLIIQFVIAAGLLFFGLVMLGGTIHEWNKSAQAPKGLESFNEDILSKQNKREDN